jgi:hypothetical protein
MIKSATQACPAILAAFRFTRISGSTLCAELTGRKWTLIFSEDNLPMRMGRIRWVVFQFISKSMEHPDCTFPNSVIDLPSPLPALASRLGPKTRIATIATTIRCQGWMLKGINPSMSQQWIENRISIGFPQPENPEIARLSYRLSYWSHG